MIQCNLNNNDIIHIQLSLMKLYKQGVTVNEIINKLGDFLSPNFVFSSTDGESVDLTLLNVNRFFAIPIANITSTKIPLGANTDATNRLIELKKYFRDLSRRWDSDLEQYLQNLENQKTDLIPKQEFISDEKPEVKDIQGINPETKTNENGSELNEDPTEDYSDEIDYSRKLESKNLNDLYGSAILVNYAMQDDFKRELVAATFINLKDGIITRDISQLNKNINEYKNNLLKNIVNYFNLKGDNTKYSPVYNTGKVPNIKILNRVLEKAPSIFGDVTPSKLESSYGKINDEQSQAFILAYNSYAILNNFDSLVKQILPDVVHINKTAIGKDDYTGNKYFLKLNNNMITSWRTTENVDAITEIGNISKILIEITPYKTYEGDIVPNRYVKVNEFIQTFAKIKIEEISRLFPESYPKLIKLDPLKYLNLTLEFVLDPANKSIFNDYLTQGDLDILRSSYDMFFKKKKKRNENYSIYEVMIKEQNQGLPLYDINLLETIIGTIDRVEKANYIQYAKDFTTNDIMLKNILDSSKGTFKLHLENNINIANKMHNEESRLDIQERYDSKIENIYDTPGINFRIPGIDGKFHSDLDGELLFNGTKITDYSTIFGTVNSDNILDVIDNPQNLKDRNTQAALKAIDDLLFLNLTKRNEALLLTYIDVTKDPTNFMRGLLTVFSKVLFNNEVELNSKLTELSVPSVLESTNYYNNQNKSNLSYFYDSKIKALKSFTGYGLNVLDGLARAQAILQGELYKNNTKDLAGNSTPTTRITNLYKNVPALLKLASLNTNVENNILSSNLLYRNVRLLKDVQITSDGQERIGDTVKKSASFNISEVGYSSILYDFLGGLYGENNEYYIQPTTYSDKSSHYKLVIDTNLNITGIVDPITKSEMNPVNLKNASAREIHELNFAIQYHTYNTLKNNLISDYRNAFSVMTDEEKSHYGFSVDKSTDLTWEDAKKYMKLLGKDDKKGNGKSIYDMLSARARKAGLQSDNVEEVHYSTNAGNPGVNNLIDYYIRTYSLKEGNSTDLMDRVSDLYISRINRGKKKLLKNIFDNNISFNFIYGNGETNNFLMDIINKQSPEFKAEWLNNDLGRMIIAKYDGKEISSLTEYGSILSDKNIRDNNFKIDINPLIVKYFDHNILISNNFNTAIIGPPYGHPSKGAVDFLTENTDTLINGDELDESLRQLAQFKRMVILPATLHTYLQRTITGIPTKYKISVIKDVGAPTFNYTGLSGGVDAHDGGALVNPLMSILENLSLQDSSVGLDKKPIGHFYAPRYGSAGLLKFALYTINNERLRITTGSEISLKNMLRKMIDFKWDIPVLDLTINYNEKTQNIPDLLKERVFFKDGNKNIEILSMESLGNNLYNFTKVQVDQMGNRIGETYTTKNYIDTNYKLWESLGAEYSQSLVNGYLEYSDASLENTVKFINSVGIKRTPDNARKYNHDLGQKEYGSLVSYREIDTTPHSQNTIYQPMKHSMISYLVNKSAIKNGGANLNSTYSYYDTSALDNMTIDTQNLGIQLDADHEADESELTEMSQVISALSENGFTHSIAKDTYISLAQVVERTIQPQLSAMNKYYDTNDKTEVVDLITKALMKVHSDTERNSAGLAKSIIDKIREEIKLEPQYRKYRMPFSDPNIMSTTISTITSMITRSSIRRKYSGIASVLIPSYNMIQTFDVDGISTKYDNLITINPILTNEELNSNPELLQRATSSFENITEPTQYDDGSYSKPFEAEAFSNINEYAAYLNQLDAKYETLYPLRGNFISEGNYIDYINEQIKKDNKLQDLINKTNESEFINTNQLEIESSYEVYDKNTNELLRVETLDTFLKYNTLRDSPSLFKFKKALYVPQNLKPSRISFNIGNGLYSIFDLDPTILMFNGDTSLQRKKYVQESFEQIRNGLIDLPQRVMTDILAGVLDPSTVEFVRNGEILDYETTKDFTGAQVRISNLTIKEAELILPRIYQTQFGLRTGDNINNIVNQKADFFYNRIKEKLRNRTSNFDVVLKRGNGSHLYIMFSGNIPENMKPVDIETYVQDGVTYRVNEFGDYMYDINGIEVMTDNTGSEILVVNNPKTVMDLYQSESFDLIDFNVNTKKINEILQFLNDPNADKNLIRLRDRFNGSIERANGNISLGFTNQMKGKEIWQDELLREASQKKYSSFIRSLEFVAARIPSQAMQSFMPMKVIEFTDVEKNIAYVSHFQMWLQGSDFDIDKVFLMGSEYDDNGNYIGWSPLFDYSTPEKLKLSENLPIPNGIKYTIMPSSDAIQGIDITDLVINLYLKSFPGNEKGYNVDIESMAELLNYINTNNYNTTTTGNAILTINTSMLQPYLGDGMKTMIPNLIGTINYHTLYEPKGSLAVAQFKNSVSSKIYKIINDPRNFVAAYSPVEMDEPARAAETSQAGKEAKTLALDSPSTNWIMQFQNMAGKEVIGIAAVGEKVFFALSYYFNEGLLNPEWYDNLTFSKTFEINGKKITRNMLANANFREYANALNYWQELIEESIQRSGEDLSPEEYQLLLNRAIDTQINGNQNDAALIISALLSAATDNAKELILSKINAGSDFASIYIYSIMLGIDFQDIAEFMKSNTVQLISKLNKNNIFDDNHISYTIDDLINYYISEDHNLNLSNFNLDGALASRTLLDDFVNNGDENLKKISFAYSDANTITEYTNFSLYNPGYLNFLINEGLKNESLKNEIIKASKSFPDKYGKNFNIKISRVFENAEYLNKLDINREELLLLDTLKKLSTELADLGRIFKVNQGLPTTISGLYTYQQNIEQAVFTASKNFLVFEKAKLDPSVKVIGFVESTFLDYLKSADLILKDKPYLVNTLGDGSYDTARDVVYESLIKYYDIATNFSFDRYISDDDYREDSIKYYNLVKGTFNILDVIDKVPHFKAMIKAFKASYDITDIASTRYREIKRIANRYSKDRAFNGTKIYPAKIDERTINNISDFFNEVIISKWLRNIDKTFIIEPGNRVLTRKGELSAPLTSNYELDLGTDYGQATFKYWFETVAFFNMRNGIVDQGYKPVLSENRFIQGLKVTTKDDPYTLNLINFIKLDINMTNITTDFDKIRYQTFLVDFKQLDKYTINGTPISELFFLYNIIVNKNKYGSNNLTKLFEDYISSGESVIINDYLKYVGDIDYTDSVIEGEDYSYDDVLLRIAPVLKQNELRYKNYRYARVYDSENKTYDYYMNDYRGNKVNFTKMLGFTPESVNYFRTRMPSLSTIYKSNISNLNRSEFEDSIKRLIANNQIQILLNCE